MTKQYAILATAIKNTNNDNNSNNHSDSHNNDHKINILVIN